MSQTERSLLILILSFIAAFMGFDIFTDAREGAPTVHIFMEAIAGLLSLGGVFYYLRLNYQLRYRLKKSIRENNDLKIENETWKTETKKFTEGLSHSIDMQLAQWHLSHAEKEVALLLLKGLSLKEIAEIRETSEKTARIQSMAVYSKSGLSGRSELAAFFLEDLLQPQK